MRTAKRLLLIFVAFLFSGIFVAVWRELIPPSAISGAIMGVIVGGIVFGIWTWSKRLK